VNDNQPDIIRMLANALKYDGPQDPKPLQTLAVPTEELAQKGTTHCASPDSLGEPLGIEHVAELLGCSAWTVRQQYLRQGLPHIRTCAGGRFVFFREQVIAWILKRQQLQQKGGYRK
jgi:hypothetical protein